MPHLHPHPRLVIGPHQTQFYPLLWAHSRETRVCPAVSNAAERARGLKIGHWIRQVGKHCNLWIGAVWMKRWKGSQMAVGWDVNGRWWSAAGEGRGSFFSDLFCPKGRWWKSSSNPPRHPCSSRILLPTCFITEERSKATWLGGRSLFKILHSRKKKKSSSPAVEINWDFSVPC